MAKQKGPFILLGTVGNVTGYEMGGQYLLREKSNLTGERVKTDPAFAETMRRADYVKLASPMASAVHRTLPKEKRTRAHYQELFGKANSMFNAGCTVEDVQGMLVREAEAIRASWGEV